MKIESLKIYLPETWMQDLNTALRNSPPVFKHDINYFKYLGQLIYYRLSRISEEKLLANNGYIAVNKKLLQKRVRDYRQYLDYLTSNGLLEEDKQYHVGLQSGGIRYPAKYATQPVNKDVITKWTLIKSILQSNDVDEESTDDGIEGTVSSVLSVPKYLKHWLTDGNLEIDMEEAKKRLQKIKEEERLQIGAGKDVHLDMIRYNARMISVYKINDKDNGSITLDKTAGRLHSNLTILKKDLRGALTYAGQKLCSIDVVNSQPFLLISILDPTICERHKIADTILKYNPALCEKLKTEKSGKNQQKEIEVSNIPSPPDNNTIASIMVVNFISGFYKNSDVKQYIEWVCEGLFYEEFGDELIQNNLMECTQKDCRKMAKICTFRVLFDRNTSIGFSDEMKGFKEIFPSVYAVIQYVKYSTKEKSYHNALACTLQNFEANLILNHCCGTIAKEKPDLPLFTIHDSIVTTAGNEEYVKGVMERVFKEQLDRVPQIVFEYWN